MKKIMIRCDIEGVSGVVSYAQAEPGMPEYDYGRKMLMADLFALIEGLTEGRADDILIYDEHYDGRNVDVSLLPPIASVICGKPPYRDGWAGGLDETFAGVVLLGFHSKAGAPGGLLPHSYELDITDITLNGVSVGEIGMEAAIAGDYGVPVMIVTGDSAGVAEAEQLLPGVVGVVVKESLAESGGMCYSTEVTGDLIRRAARDTLRVAPKARPYKVGPDVRLEVSLRDGVYLNAMRECFSAAMSGNNTVVVEGNSATQVWAEYWRMKLAGQCRTII